MINIPTLDFKNGITNLNAFARRVTVGHFTSHHALNHTVLGHIVLTLDQRFNGLTITDDCYSVRYIFNLI